MHQDHRAFALPPPSVTENLLSNIRRATAATLAAITLTISRPHASPGPVPPPPPAPAYRMRSPLRYACAPVVVFDKDYATRAPSIWHFDTERPDEPLRLPPEKSRPALDRALTRLPPLPPGPHLSSEVRVLTRLLVALVVGGVIGMERRAANSLAGVRTFSLVSLGAAIFMSTTLVAFPDADPARVAAAISSSVGFLGAGAMHKSAKHSRGLTTASSVWLAAALGISAACGMFLLSFTGAISTVLIARYARFDSSLHLIRGDPLGDDDPDGMDDIAEYSEHGLGYAESNGMYGFKPRRRQESFYNENGDRLSPQEVRELQSIVDFDPSSERDPLDGSSRGVDGSSSESSGRSQNGIGNGNHAEER